jgi:hypothetical protein
MSKESKEKMGEKPITIRGRNGTILSIFVSETKLTFSVSRRAGESFENVDRYAVPVSWLMAEILRRNKGAFLDWIPVNWLMAEVFRKNKDAFRDWCEVLDAIEESSE